jgi:hypothetical protein
MNRKTIKVLGFVTTTTLPVHADASRARKSAGRPVPGGLALLAGRAAPVEGRRRL